VTEKASVLCLQRDRDRTDSNLHACRDMVTRQLTSFPECEPRGRKSALTRRNDVGSLMRCGVRVHQLEDMHDVTVVRPDRAAA
jgi:hypothetical protein